MTIITIVEMLVHTLKDGSIFASVLGTLGFTLAFTAGVMYVIQDSLCRALPLPGVLILIYSRGLLWLTGHRTRLSTGWSWEFSHRKARRTHSNNLARSLDSLSVKALRISENVSRFTQPSR
jgi:hypothetical protein